MKTLTMYAIILIMSISFISCQKESFSSRSPSKKTKNYPKDNNIIINPQEIPLEQAPPIQPDNPLDNNDNDDNSPNNFTINFSMPGAVWHIGDGAYSGSSCKIFLWFKKLKGDAFNYNFTVIEDNTKVNIKVRWMCGIDYNNTNFAYLKSRDNAQEYQKISIVKGQNSIRFNEIILNKGKYFVRVETTNNPNNNNDKDDFIVGNVKITADKEIIKGDVTQN